MLSRRSKDRPGKLIPKRPSPYVDRRGMSLLGNNGNGRPSVERRKAAERRKRSYAVPFPDRRLTRSAYEQVFLKLVSGGRLRIGNDLYTPVGMKGWYHAVFRRESDGAEKLLTIDQLLKKMNDWTGNPERSEGSMEQFAMHVPQASPFAPLILRFAQDYV